MIDGYIETVAGQVLLCELTVSLDRLLERVKEAVRNPFQMPQPVIDISMIPEVRDIGNRTLYICSIEIPGVPS